MRLRRSLIYWRFKLAVDRLIPSCVPAVPLPAAATGIVLLGAISPAVALSYQYMITSSGE